MAEQKRKSPKERNLDAPVLALNIDEEAKRLANEPEWISGTEDGITLVKNPHLRVVLIAMKKGARMRDHKVEGPVSLFVVSGRINLVVGDKEHRLRRKGLFSVQRAVVHDVRAEADSVFLLTVMPVDGKKLAA